MSRSTAETPTRERIVNAAMEVFAVRGYHGTVVDDIVAASGTSKGAFYHYFRSKQAIFVTLMNDLASVVEQGVEAGIASEKGALAKIEAALRVVIETAAARRDLVRILLIEAVGLGPTMEQPRLDVHRRFAQLIQRHLDHAIVDGDIPPQDTALAAQAWIGALNEVITQWLVANKGELMDSLPTLRTLLLRSIGAGATQPETHTRGSRNHQTRPLGDR